MTSDNNAPRAVDAEELATRLNHQPPTSPNLHAVQISLATRQEVEFTRQRALTARLEAQRTVQLVKQDRARRNRTLSALSKNRFQERT